MDNNDFNMCPVGIRNEKEIEHTKDRFELAMQRLEEKMDDMKNDISTLSSDMNKKLNSIDNRFETLEKKMDEIQNNIPETVDKEIERRNSSVILQIIKWLVITVGGSLAITVITRYVLRLLGF